ncbi:hypothetical protein LEP1GSC082_4451 [Leptospira kirschneri str. H2]|uniref:Uncharacterized protein n=2 Tax=Leptospira kirschneri TaxID=29507 RepID=A0A0E2B7N2_9LEPT|nr:hypothetical protein LEP1GSC081_2250 [Leptospira kirschneri str. H1]EKO62300.1 hypothetical protein LEP1GSC082_4451 [Leptospira kirschneri str. H2]EMK24728.1 hypothetical protein LEP1GSC008_1896 [Leptospira kirschneri serovar Bulgarica str. Nikolaevo]
MEKNLKEALSKATPTSHSVFLKMSIVSRMDPKSFGKINDSYQSRLRLILRLFQNSYRARKRALENIDPYSLRRINWRLLAKCSNFLTNSLSIRDNFVRFAEQGFNEALLFYNYKILIF